MLNSDILIINSKSEINSKTLEILEVCCVTYNEMKISENNTKIIYTFV